MTSCRPFRQKPYARRYRESLRGAHETVLCAKTELAQHCVLVCIASPVQLKDLLVWCPRKTTAMSTIAAAISATMIPYSTAVAPRSLFTFKRAATQALVKRAIPKRFLILTPSLLRLLETLDLLTEGEPPQTFCARGGSPTWLPV